MDNDFYTQEKRNEQLNQHLGGQNDFGGSLATESLGRYTGRVFALMFLGLLVTFVVGFWLSWTYSGFRFLYNAFTYVPALHIVLMVAELAVVIVLSRMVRKLSPTAALALFFVYAVLTGFTFGVIFLAYDVTSLVLAFGATALYFGGMAVFGYLTQIDLSRIRTFLLAGLVFLIVLNILMLFIPGLQAADRILCTLGVILFLAYTAYDTQKIKAFYAAYQGDEAMLKKTAVLSALELYLDFVNLFLYVLRLLGKKRN